MRSGTIASTGPAGSVVVDAAVVVVSGTVVEVVVDAGIVVVVVVDVVDVSVGPGSEVSSVVQPVTATINDTAPINDAAPINDTGRASRGPGDHRLGTVTDPPGSTSPSRCSSSIASSSVRSSCGGWSNQVGSRRRPSSGA